MILAVTGAFVVLIAVKEAIFPVPDSVSPILVLSLVQLNIVLPTNPLKFKGAVATPLQITWFNGTITLGVGFTIIVKLCTVPTQPFAEGVIVITAVNWEAVGFVAVKEA